MTRSHFIIYSLSLIFVVAAVFRSPNICLQRGGSHLKKFIAYLLIIMLFVGIWIYGANANNNDREQRKKQEQQKLIEINSTAEMCE